MGITPEQFRLMEIRVNNGKTTTPLGPPEGKNRYAVSAELPLHDEAIKWANSQWPRIKYTHARPDQKSTIAKGHHDFTFFLPGGKVLCVEFKDKDGKLSTDQLQWQNEMAKLGHPVHVCRSMQDLFLLVNDLCPELSNP